MLRYVPKPFELARLFTRLMTKWSYPPQGWDIAWREDSGERIAFDVHRCFYLDVLTAYGMPELTAAFCSGDDELFKALPDSIRWERTGTLATGKAKCDFCWRKHTKEEVVRLGEATAATGTA